MGGRSIILGIAGGSASGKSTVAREVVRRLGADVASVIQHDAYYRDLAHWSEGDRATVNFDHPDSLETELLAQHLGLLLTGTEVSVPVYDFETHTRRPETTTVGPTPIIILEGILVLTEPRLREKMNLKVFVDAPADVRLIRRLRRDVTGRGRTPESVFDQYMSTVRPMHLEFVEPSRRHADMIIREGGNDPDDVDLLITKLRQLLLEHGHTDGLD